MLRNSIFDLLVYFHQHNKEVWEIMNQKRFFKKPIKNEVFLISKIFSFIFETNNENYLLVFSNLNKKTDPFKFRDVRNSHDDILLLTLG